MINQVDWEVRFSFCSVYYAPKGGTFQRVTSD